MMGSANLSDLTNATTARTNLGLGTLATASAVGSTEIADGAIANVDISATAAVATSKLSGAVTAISGHGLGTLATLSGVGATEITDASIANADISATAAIDASKIANGGVSSTEFQYLDGVTSSVQTQLDAKASAASPTFTGAILSALGSTAAPTYSFTGDPDTGVWSSGADTVNVSAAGSEPLGVTSTGNVGIGTTAPAGLLDVNGKLTVLSGGNVGIGTATAQSLLQVYNGGGTANLSAETASLKVTNTSANELAIGTNPASPYEAWLQVKRSNNNGMSYPLALQPAGGNVGIGTTAPGGLLDVGASSQFRIDSSGDVTKVKGVAYSWPSSQGGASTVLTNNGSGTLSWSAAGGSSQWTTNASNIYYSSGNVGIGTTAPLSVLDVRSPSVSYLDNRFNIFAFDTTAMAANVGGGIGFGGYDTSGGGVAERGPRDGAREVREAVVLRARESRVHGEGPAVTTSEEVKRWLDRQSPMS